MLMMWVTPSRTSSAMFWSFHIPPPNAMRSVTQVISIYFDDAMLQNIALGDKKQRKARRSKVEDYAARPVYSVPEHGYWQKHLGIVCAKVELSRIIETVISVAAHPLSALHSRHGRLRHPGQRTGQI